MNIQPQTVAIDRVLSLIRSQGMVETDPVDFVEFLLAGVQSRDLDAIADDIVCFVVGLEDVTKHVTDRLDVQLAFIEAGQPQERRQAAEYIVKAIRAIVGSRLSRGSGL
jgi:hypothetical protein